MGLCFHLYQYAVNLFHVQHLDIELVSNHSSLLASIKESHFFIKFHFKSYCIISLLHFEYFQNLHFLGELCHNLLYLCCTFSLAVHHSRFSSLLSILIQFLWFTWGLFSGLGMNAIAIALCNDVCLVSQPLWKVALIYQYISYWCFIFFSLLWNLPFLIKPNLFNFHKLLTWYNHSNHGISFQASLVIAIKKTLYRGGELRLQPR